MTGLAFIFPALGGGLFGYDIGATSGALVSLTNAATAGTDWCGAVTPTSLCDHAVPTESPGWLHNILLRSPHSGALFASEPAYHSPSALNLSPVRVT